MKMIMIFARLHYNIVCSPDLAWNQLAISSSLLDINHYSYFMIVPFNRCSAKNALNMIMSSAYDNICYLGMIWNER